MRQELLWHLSSSRKRWIPRLMLTFGFVLFYLLSIMAIPATTFAEGVPGGHVEKPEVRATDIASPAVVRIITTIGGHLTVRFTNQSVTFPTNGGSYNLELSGSGAFITQHGDILTADHVVNPPHDQSLDAYLDQQASTDVANYVNENSQAGSTQYTPQYIALLLVDGYLPSTSHYDPPTSEAYLSTSYTGPSGATTLQGLPMGTHATVDKIEQESNFDQKDVAIVHVNMTDTPSIQVGDSSNVEPQDQLTIIGFPGNGDVSQKEDPTDFLTPSINQVFVSSIKKTDTGAGVIQVGGNVEHGDSGGPALDSNGNVMGIVSFGLQQADSPGSTSFLQASNSARDLIQALGLDTKPGPFQTSWAQAFSNYASTAAGHWHKAAQGFDSLAAKYPTFQAITTYQTYAKDKASHEQVQPPQAHTDYTWYIVGGMLILIVLLSLIAVARRRRQPLVATSSSSTLMPGQPAMTPQLASLPGQPLEPVAQVAQDFTPTYPARNMGQPSWSSSPDQPSPFQPSQPSNPYQPAGSSSPDMRPLYQPSQPSNPYQSAPQPSQPSNPYQPIGQSAPDFRNPYQPSQAMTPQYPPARPASSDQLPQVPAVRQPGSEVRPPYQPTWPPSQEPQYPARPLSSTPGQPFNVAQSAFPPWQRPEVPGQPQPYPGSGEQPSPDSTNDEDKTMRSSQTPSNPPRVNIGGSRPDETELRDRPDNQ